MKTKLEQFKKRNKNRNSILYKKEKIEGIDYILCPVSRERLSMIKSSYIERVLCMTVDEYDRLYPGVRGVSTARKNNIKEGLHKVDKKTGKTKYQISQEKARKKLSEVGDDGVSGYKRKGQKTRATHMNKIDEHGRNGYQKQVYNRLNTILPNGLTVEENAHKKQRNTIIKNKRACNRGASKLSKKSLKPILDFLNEYNIDYYFDQNEYGIKDINTGNYYFYDLTISKFNMTIEYQSNAWHANPTMTDVEWKQWHPPRGKKKTANEVLKYDYTKARALYENRGFLTFYVWQKSEDDDIKEILCLLKTQIMKY